MKHKLILFWILILLSFSCKKPGIVINNGFAIKNITIIDPIDGLSENMTIIIKDKKIVNIDKSKNINISPKSIIYDGTDKYIIPGLWDFHVHFAFIEELAPSLFNLFLLEDSCHAPGGYFVDSEGQKQNGPSHFAPKGKIKIIKIIKIKWSQNLQNGRN